ncbi:hypothetical protein SeseC_02530 [Streptococcus equi subsp. zooepidemicus ATCC 35246]|nr:hypothetical protein SeseC_02530 [Streptococcus equi subsp. zooepidemicus ATCC 35246]
MVVFHLSSVNLLYFYFKEALFLAHIIRPLDLASFAALIL